MERKRKKQKKEGIARLKRNAVGKQLELVVNASTVARVALLDKIPHKVRRLPLRLVHDEAIPEILHALGLEARQAAVHHELDNLAELFAVLAAGEEGLYAELLKGLEALVVGRAAHDGHHLAGELEGGALELDAAGRNVEAEAKVNVEDVAGVVNHDVAVVAVFELQQEGDDGVGGHGFDKVAAGLLEAEGVLVAVFGDKVVVEPVDGFTAEHVSGD